MVNPDVATGLVRNRNLIERWLQEVGGPPIIDGHFELRSLVAYLRRKRRHGEGKDNTCRYHVSLPGLRVPSAPSLTDLLEKMSDCVVGDGTTVPRAERYGRGDWVSRERWT